ncbi:MAG: hypothetical protein AB1705_13075 [Verrucomicrobiota bacterium]
MKYRFHTKAGVFEIEQRSGRWHAMFLGESLGSYATPQDAAGDLALGHTFTPSTGVDPGTLGIAEDLSEWEEV